MEQDSERLGAPGLGLRLRDVQVIDLPVDIVDFKLMHDGSARNNTYP